MRRPTVIANIVNLLVQVPYLDTKSLLQVFGSGYRKHRSRMAGLQLCLVLDKAQFRIQSRPDDLVIALSKDGHDCSVDSGKLARVLSVDTLKASQEIPSVENLRQGVVRPMPGFDFMRIRKTTTANFKHFHSPDLIHLYLQFRMFGIFDTVLLIDWITNMQKLPVRGQPDIVAYFGDPISEDGRTFLDGLCMIEWEASEKSSSDIFHRLKVLSSNEHDYIIVVSREMRLLRKWASVIRRASTVGMKCGTSTLHFDAKMSRAAAEKLWFMHYDPSANSDWKDTSILGHTKIRRYDNTSFDPSPSYLKTVSSHVSEKPFGVQRLGGASETTLAHIMAPYVAD